MSTKKISKTVWVVASIIGVAILGVGGYFAFRTPNSKASDNPELLGGTGASESGLGTDILNTASSVLTGSESSGANVTTSSSMPQLEADNLAKMILTAQNQSPQTNASRLFVSSNIALLTSKGYAYSNGKATKATASFCFDEFGGYYKKNNKNWGE